MPARRAVAYIRHLAYWDGERLPSATKLGAGLEIVECDPWSEGVTVGLENVGEK